jgi:glycosyltransferase involved in cell wall biosynthesis
LNICIVSSWLPSKKRPNLGSFVYNFVENLGRSGLKVSVISPFQGDDESITQNDLMTIYRVNARFPLFSFIDLINKIRPDIIHVHAPNFFSCNAIPAAKLRKIPIIATVHRAEIDKVGKLVFFFRKHALARFNKIIAVSDYTKSLALKAGVEASKINIIYNTCDEKFFFYRKDKYSLRKKLDLESNDRIILFVGNLIRRKGVSCLVESLNILFKRLPDFLAIIVGEGQELETLRSMVNGFALSDRVKFYGRITKETLSELYCAADVFVLPSISEGHSVALLEAMASGLPIVASDVEGNKESLEEGVNGFLFKTGSSEELAEKLEIILTDQKLKQFMSVKSSEAYISKFSTNSQINDHLKIYESLIN